MIPAQSPARTGCRAGGYGLGEKNLVLMFSVVDSGSLRVSGKIAGIPHIFCASLAFLAFALYQRNAKTQGRKSRKE